MMPVFDFSNIIKKNILHSILQPIFLDSALNWQFGGCGSKVPISSGSNYPAGSSASALHSSSCLVSNVNIKRERESEQDKQPKQLADTVKVDVDWVLKYLTELGKFWVRPTWFLVLFKLCFVSKG